MSAGLSDTQSVVLRALCDTYVPSIKVPDDPTGFWARTASDLGVDGLLTRFLVQDGPPELRGALRGLLDVLASKGFVKASQARREAILAEVSGSSPQAASGLAFFEKQTLQLTYGLPEGPVPDPNLVIYGSTQEMGKGCPNGQNPNWQVLGYPGPVTVPHANNPDVRFDTVVPKGDRLTLEADVCVVGSGAGGAVIAARMAMRGRRVVVLEAGGQFTTADFYQNELWGYRNLWYRGGGTPTADGNVLLLAGGTLGGGTEINWMNCVRTPPVVRADWVRQFGLDGVDSAEFDRYIEAVETRIMASPRTAYQNAPNLRMKEGCERLGYLSQQTHVNWDPELFNPLLAGYTGFGDQTGGKQTARRTFLADAYRHGARIMVHCRADRVLVEQGRAAGVEATYSDPQGRRAAVTVRAPQVVVACGSLESPALLLRSGIGGPAVGQYLHLQPGGAVYGLYKEKQRGWWGSPMTANCEQFVDTGAGFGFYMEIPAFGPGFVGSVIPWASGRQHKEMMTKVPFISTFIWFLRDRGYGRISLDAAGNSVATYALTDETDQKNFRHATAEAVRIHEAAGAQEVYVSLAHGQIHWKRGQSLEGFIQEVTKLPLLNGAQPMISAHQLSTCRMGSDPATSVADTNGELHDVKGVWMGDASACPTSLGANPMVTIMALAERTADRMAPPPRQGREAVPARAADTFRELTGVMAAPLNVVRGMAGLMMNPATMAREMAGILMNPLNMISLGGRLLSGAAAAPVTASLSDRAVPARTVLPPRPELAPTYSHIIGLTAKPGRGRDLVDAIRDQAIPRVIAPAEGFVYEIVLVSLADPDAVEAISFWRDKEVFNRWYKNGFAQVSALLEPLLSVEPKKRFDLPFGVEVLAGTNGLEPPAGPRADPSMYSHVIELTAKPGQVGDLIGAIRDQAIPRLIRGSAGFVEEMVLRSDTDRNQVSAISFWRSREDGDRFSATGFARVSALLQPFLDARPVRQEFVVGASTDSQIQGWRR
jgi:choline dehydrogenase-like flavoprotein/heme-degrading monooxygenase HmoA